MQNPLNNNSDDALLSMADNTWITYLCVNRICPAIRAAFLSNQYMYQIFGNEESITEYKRDDFTITSLPAMSIYLSESKRPSRYYSERGEIGIDMFLPIRLDRQDTTTVLITLTSAIENILQSQPFWTELNNAMVPLPELNSPIYNDVMKYKNQHGSPLVEFGKEIEALYPVKYNLGAIGDAWKIQLKTSYYFDMSNFYAMLESFGIQAQTDPNKIVYDILQNFSINAKPIYTDEGD